MTENYVRKIKRNKMEEESLMFPCFQISSGVKLKDIPTTGEEYLLKVINERSKCQRVTKCETDYSKLTLNQSQYFVQEIPHLKAPESLKPSVEWQKIQVADFSDIRLYISHLHEKRSQWPNVRKLHVIKLDTVWKTFFESNEPTLSCSLGLNYKLFHFGLEYLTYTLDDVKPGDTIPYKTAQWIYAMLACIGQPLLRESASLLRNLARKCAEVRSHINPENEVSKELAAPLNIIICLVSRYFGQFDLAD